VAASGHGHTYTLSTRGRGRQFSTRTLKPRLRCPKYVVRRLSPPNRIHGTRRFVDRQHLRYRDSAQAASSLGADVEIADVPLALSLMRQLTRAPHPNGTFHAVCFDDPRKFGNDGFSRVNAALLLLRPIHPPLKTRQHGWALRAMSE
jgi:hypothetical protein